MHGSMADDMHSDDNKLENIERIIVYCLPFTPHQTKIRAATIRQNKTYHKVDKELMRDGMLWKSMNTSFLMGPNKSLILKPKKFQTRYVKEKKYKRYEKI